MAEGKMHDGMSDNAMEMLFVNCKVSKIYKDIYTHLFYDFYVFVPL